MRGRGLLFSSKRLLHFSWLKLVILLVVLLASLQVLHMMLLSRLEEKNAHLHREKVFRSIQKEVHNLYQAMKESLQNTHIVDSSGQYKVVHSFYDTAKLNSRQGGANYHSQDKGNIVKDSEFSLVSQCSVNHLPHLAALSQRWRGPISVAVFATDSKSIEIAIEYLLHLYQCQVSMRHNVSIHLVYPLVEPISALPDSLPVASVNTKSCTSEDNFSNQKMIQSRNYAFNKDVKYPNNLLRNIAVHSVQTEYVFVIDIDMLPSANLQKDFINFIKKYSLSTNNKNLNNRTVFVVPAFELQHGVSVPIDKKSLLKLWKLREIKPFYFDMCPRCQKPTDYEVWRNLSLSSILSVGYEVEWKDPWEPFYIGPTSIPPYDERFKQYGFNRISQVCEMHVAGYKFAVLNNAFLVHKGFKTPDTFHLTKDMEQERNRLLFRQFKEELKSKYPDSTKRCY